jgi:hypothetical protein
MKPTRKQLNKRLKQKLLQVTISQDAHDKLADLARREVRTSASYARRVLYQHLGIAE